MAIAIRKVANTNIEGPTDTCLPSGTQPGFSVYWLPSFLPRLVLISPTLQFKSIGVTKRLNVSVRYDL